MFLSVLPRIAKAMFSVDGCRGIYYKYIHETIVFLCHCHHPPQMFTLLFCNCFQLVNTVIVEVNLKNLEYEVSITWLQPSKSETFVPHIWVRCCNGYLLTKGVNKRVK